MILKAGCGRCKRPIVGKKAFDERVMCPSHDVSNGHSCGVAMHKGCAEYVHFNLNYRNDDDVRKIKK